MVFDLFETTLASRKFVDLIFRSSSQYANLRPSIAIEVGDYGRVDRRSGFFFREGNVYKLRDSASIPDFPPIDAPTTGKKEDKLITMSQNGRTFDGSLSGNLGSETSPTNAAISLCFEFKKQRGATVVMHNSQLTMMPNELRLKTLLERPELRDKAVVTEVYRCSSYALLLTDKGGAKASIQLLASTPLAITGAPIPATASGSLSDGWSGNSSSGTWKMAHDPEGNLSYYPLVGLRSSALHIASVPIRSSEKQDIRDLTTLPPYEPPWRSLDEDGEEDEPFVD